MAKVWLLLLVATTTAPLLSSGSPLHSRSLSGDGRDAVSFFKTHLRDSASSPSLSSGFTCDTCKAFFGIVRYLFDLGMVRDEIAKLSVEICTDFKIEDATVCSGVVSLFKVVHLRRGFVRYIYSYNYS